MKHVTDIVTISARDDWDKRKNIPTSFYCDIDTDGKSIKCVPVACALDLNIMTRSEMEKEHEIVSLKDWLKRKVKIKQKKSRHERLRTNESRDESESEEEEETDKQSLNQVLKEEGFLGGNVGRPNFNTSTFRLNEEKYVYALTSIDPTVKKRIYDTKLCDMAVNNLYRGVGNPETRTMEDFIKSKDAVKELEATYKFLEVFRREKKPKNNSAAAWHPTGQFTLITKV